MLSFPSFSESKIGCYFVFFNYSSYKYTVQLNDQFLFIADPTKLSWPH